MSEDHSAPTRWQDIVLPLAAGFMLGLAAFLVIHPAHPARFSAYQAHRTNPAKAPNAPAHYKMAGPFFDRA